MLRSLTEFFDYNLLVEVLMTKTWKVDDFYNIREQKSIKLVPKFKCPLFLSSETVKQKVMFTLCNAKFKKNQIVAKCEHKFYSTLVCTLCCKSIGTHQGTL